MSARRGETATSLVSLMPASSRAPDNFGLLCVAAICAALSGLRAYRMTSRPARAATLASAVPHAPAPITATDWNEGINRTRCAPSPRTCGERVGVRGCLREFRWRGARGEPPSPGSHLRCDPTSPRKRGEVRRNASRDIVSLKPKTPRGYWQNLRARWRCRRAASARGAGRPWCRSCPAPAVPRRPRRSSRRCRCRARAAE